MPALSKTFCVACLLIIAAGLPARAADDPHALFEERCGRCHGHAGPFTAEAVVLRDGRAVTRAAGTPLADFLRGHRGRPSAEVVAALTAHMTAIARRGGLYRDKCGACHGTARDLARDKLILRDGRVVGRYSGTDMAGFLPTHGRASTAEADVLLDMLRQQLTALGR